MCLHMIHEYIYIYVYIVQLCDHLFFLMLHSYNVTCFKIVYYASIYTQQYTAYIYSHPEVDRIWNVQRYSFCLVICLLNILPSGK